MKLFAAVILLFSTGAVAGPRTSHLQALDLRQCRPTGCLQATAPEAAMSMTNDVLSAEGARVQIFSKSGALEKSLNCASLRYELTAQFLTCDNRDQDGTAFTLNADFSVHHYNLSGGPR
jgi:hypothetical protein